MSKANAAGKEKRDEYYRNQQQQQQMLIRDQDEKLDELGLAAERLHHTAMTINTEIKDQQVMLNELENEVDAEAEKMNFVMKKMAKLLQTSDTKQICLVLFLFVVFLILVFLVMYT
mmetsp:Transcript_24140/g.47431  ORF Transcript_24140/g.47431 Transcript_24140/m.47431 type:complete len:116 (+) Transcript_24140:291-638(+)